MATEDAGWGRTRGKRGTRREEEGRGKGVLEGQWRREENKREVRKIRLRETEENEIEMLKTSSKSRLTRNPGN